MKIKVLLIAASCLFFRSSAFAALSPTCLEMMSEILTTDQFSVDGAKTLLEFTRGDLKANLFKLPTQKRFTTILNLNLASQSHQFRRTIGEWSKKQSFAYDVKPQFQSYFQNLTIAEKASAIPGLSEKLAFEWLLETFSQADKPTRVKLLSFLEESVNSDYNWQITKAFPNGDSYKHEELFNAAEFFLTKFFEDHSTLIQASRAETQSGTKLQSALGPAAYSHTNNQTPYMSFLNILHSVKIKPKQTVVDIGCSYGRLGLLGGEMLPDVKFIGYDIAAEPVAEANRLAKKFGYKNSKYFVQDLSHPSFHLPEADYYYFWLPVNAETATVILSQLKKIAQKREIRLIAFQGLSSDGNFKNRDLASLGWLKFENHEGLVDMDVLVSTLHKSK